MRCTMTGEPYTVFGYGGKQVRDNIHAADLVARVRGLPPRSARGGRLQHRRRPREQLLDARGDRAVPADRRPRAAVEPRRGARIGDHRWWISDLEPFRRDYPEWGITRDVEGILHEIHDRNAERWVALGQRFVW